MSSNQTQLYQSRIPIYPRSVSGRYRTIKYVILFVAYSTYFLLPWIGWQRINGPDQAVLFDILERRFYIFDLTVYAQDIFWLAGFLIIAAFLLFFVTGIAGRVFCGYFCFQTLWTDVFLLIERLVQGDRNARMKLAKSSWGGKKFIQMGLTWFLWLSVAFWTGFSFTLYWGESTTLFHQFFLGQAPFPAYATTLFLTLTTFVMAGLAREQVCTYMCPYARFQGAMFDEDTLIVSYDDKRGERSCGRCKPDKDNKAHDARVQQGLGDCIDCGYCVQVCPVGIDIRNGLQYQCISCALCIDACNTIMSAINYPKGLIRYTSQRQQSGLKHRILKLKNIGYGAALIIVTSLLIWSIVNRSTTEMSVQQIRQPLYVQLSDGSIQNRYIVKVTNKLDVQVKYKLTLDVAQGYSYEYSPSADLVLPAGKSAQVQLIVRAHSEDKSSIQDDLLIGLTYEEEGQQKHLARKSSFYFPEAMHH